MLSKLIVLMISTHSVITGQSRAKITGILGDDITLQFTFNTSVSNSSHFAIYLEGNKKAEYCPSKGCSREHGFHIYSENSHVFCLITNLTQGHSGTYWATLFPEGTPTQRSSRVHLIIQEKSNNTVSGAQENKNTTKNQSSIFTTVIIAVIVVLLVVLLAGTLTWFFRCCVRAGGSKTQHNSPPVRQVASLESHDTSEGALAYSVVNISKIRTDTQVESRPDETQYARFKDPLQ
ncbi:uncharacterized protein LOC130919270 isoform X1 [Corythoichthys intestinalis]|uniref:uncharacterized protein LOC130919270 isoform X1 n=1 Tax=Corythoichthys intestinalis TaxID=161448 RepID=UPI0025A4F62F|nr:uncharacterized protein LOC130919270 isoform X1 [Corythoichthys intestinalis]